MCTVLLCGCLGRAVIADALTRTRRAEADQWALKQIDAEERGESDDDDE